MKNGKATFVTLIISVMLLAIDIGLYKLWSLGFLALTGTLAAYGYLRGAFDFRRWLTKERDTDVKPIDFSQEGINCRCTPAPFIQHMEHRSRFEPDTVDSVDNTVDSIIAEYQAGGADE